ncbi:MAG: hypothetical protein L0I76_20695 [Pseudonocardia sp.]|nr:hypothetical protein [Pseudonocardia sp.]
MHLVLAVVCLALARAVLRPGRWTRVRATVPLVATAVGGVGAMALPGQTWLSPAGVALTVAALALLWVPRPESLAPW